MSAQSAPRPAPFRAPVTASISRMPGPALRALVADDEHGAGLDGAGEDGLHRALLAVEHPGRALEVELVEVRPATFTTAPLGASEPREHDDAALGVDRRVERVDDHAVGRGRVELGQVLGHGLAGDGEAVAVRAGRRRAGAASRPGTPPTRSRSVMWNLPPGFMSAMWGTRAAIRLKSSRSRSTRASLAMASRWSTALVEPPRAMVTAMAFSNASFVMIWRGVMPSSQQLDHGLARRRRRRRRGGGRRRAATPSRAATCRGPRPIDAMVLAVNMPAQAPSPGQALRSIAPSSSSVMVPAAQAPTASNTLAMSSARAVVVARAGSSRRRRTPTAG